MNIKNVVDRANGQWAQIIYSLGGVKLTQNKHTACPVCGGKDRFRFDNIEGRGTYICNQCGAGDGLSLLAKIQSTSVSDTASNVASFLGLKNTIHLESKHTSMKRMPEQHKISDTTKVAVSLDKEAHFTNRLNKAILGVHEYIKGKGLSSPVLMVNNTVLIPLINTQGEVAAIQTISPSGQKRFGSGDQKKGSFYVVVASDQINDHLAFALMLPNQNLIKPEIQNQLQSESMSTNVNRSELSFIISEGVATALTAKLLMPKSLSIAAIDAGNLLPVAKAIRNHYPKATIIIAADNDLHLPKNKGVDSAIKAAKLVSGSVAIPSTDKTADWNDLYQEKGLEQTKAEFMDSIKKVSASERPKATTLADGTPLSTDELERLEMMNQNCTQVILADGSLIYSKRFDQTSNSYILKHEKMVAFISRFEHERPIAKKNPARAWLKWGGKNFKSDGVGFYPDPDKCPDTVLNLFDGFAIQPKQGDCSIYLNHILNVICAGDVVVNKCFISWLAHLVQKPDEKPSFAVVMTSEQGAGKGISIKPLLQIMGGFGVYENGIERITGRFNSTLTNKLLVFIDEVYIDKQRDAEALKSLISETVVNLEQKGIDPIPIPSYSRFIFASNRIDAIKAGIRERRYLVLAASNHHLQEKDYFDQLMQWLENDGASYLLDYLLNFDISGFDPRRAVQTHALKDLITNNLRGIDGFIYEQLLSDNPFNILGNLGRVDASELVKLYIEWSKEQGQEISRARARREIGNMFSRVLQAEKTGRSDRGMGIMYGLPDDYTMCQRFAGVRLNMNYEDLFGYAG